MVLLDGKEYNPNDLDLIVLWFGGDVSIQRKGASAANVYSGVGDRFWSRHRLMDYVIQKKRSHHVLVDVSLALIPGIYIWIGEEKRCHFCGAKSSDTHAASCITIMTADQSETEMARTMFYQGWDLDMDWDSAIEESAHRRHDPDNGGA